MTTKIYEDDCGRQIIQFASSDGKPKLEIWAEPLRLDADAAQAIGLALLKWADEQGAPKLVWVTLPASMHDAAKAAGLMKIDSRLPAFRRGGSSYKKRAVAARSGDLVLYADEICGAGTCLRPPDHLGQHDQFDGPNSPDSVPFHAYEE